MKGQRIIPSVLFLCLYSFGLQAQEPAAAFAGQKPGLYHQVQAGLAFGKESKLHEQLGVLSGYRFNRLLGLGVGLNYDRYDRTTALPVFLQPRLYLINKKTALYTFSDLGWGVSWQNNDPSTEFIRTRARGGFMGQLGIGSQLNFARAAFTFMLGLKMQKTPIHTEYWGYRYDPANGTEEAVLEKIMDLQEDRLYRRVVFSIGIMF